MVLLIELMANYTFSRYNANFTVNRADSDKTNN